MVRQHVNPLSRLYQQPRPLPPLAELFADPALPLHLDIGSARGRFLLALAPLEPGRNHLGLEIRRPLVAAAEADRQAAGQTNLAFLFANANISLPAWLQELPPGRLELVTLQFPDPWFKKKHHKRRVLQPALLQALAAALAPGCQLFLQSDVAELIAPMVALVEASGCFSWPELQGERWLPANPLPLPTERERHVLAQGLPVWRVLYTRNAEPAPTLADLEQAATALSDAEPDGDAPHGTDAVDGAPADPAPALASSTASHRPPSAPAQPRRPGGTGQGQQASP